MANNSVLGADAPVSNFEVATEFPRFAELPDAARSLIWIASVGNHHPPATKIWLRMDTLDDKHHDNEFFWTMACDQKPPAVERLFDPPAEVYCKFKTPMHLEPYLKLLHDHMSILKQTCRESKEEVELLCKYAIRTPRRTVLTLWPEMDLFFLRDEDSLEIRLEPNVRYDIFDRITNLTMTSEWAIDRTKWPCICENCREDLAECSGNPRSRLVQIIAHKLPNLRRFVFGIGSIVPESDEELLREAEEPRPGPYGLEDAYRGPPENENEQQWCASALDYSRWIRPPHRTTDEDEKKKEDKYLSLLIQTKSDLITYVSKLKARRVPCHQYPEKIKFGLVMDAKGPESLFTPRDIFLLRETYRKRFRGPELEMDAGFAHLRVQDDDDSSSSMDDGDD